MRIDLNIVMDVKSVEAQLLVNNAIDHALQVTAEALLTESNKTTPKDEGILVQSGKVSYDSLSKTGYVSYDTPYAIRLHEHPEYNFQNGRRGKWLELTMLEQKNMLMGIMSLRIRERLAMGGGVL
jgi:hypothetical protein